MRRTLAITVALAGSLCLFAAPAAADGTLTWATVNSTTTGDQDNPSVATSRDGYTAVVWEDDRDTTNPTDTAHTEVYLRLYHDGASLFERKVSTGGSGDWRHIQPDVAVRPGGDTVVVWSDDQDGNGYYQVRVRTFDAAGTLTGTATANADASGQQVNPEVAVDPDGSAFAVVFEDDQTDTAPTVRLSGYTSITSKRYERQVHANGGTNRHADVAMGAPGNAIVVWDEDMDGNGYYNVGLASFTPSGAVKLAKRLANEATGGQQRNATVAANFNGDFVAGWVTDHSGTDQVGVRSFTATGAAPAEAFLPGGDPQVGLDDQRHAVAYWHQNGDVYVQGLNPDGTTYDRQPRIRANETAAGTQTHPALAVDPYGRITMTHSDDADGDGFEEVVIGTGLTNSTW
ncbi:hypothetical protein [Actinophytocola gossypii]|uniref:VCBS repeat-containing protein n=1 Tax=Actinophytocola gossypii TaxID=2812003 RepID=A0ABT2JGK4_9PSEU|nr:hypothetical protein [Actinophytocola gossypii]MCT2586906.1 hypothetical protein [Actinophytocola gossypii]